MRPRLVHYLNETIGLNLFDWIIPTPSIIYLITFLFLSLIFIRRCKKSGFDGRIAFRSALWGGIAAFLGAKLFYVVLHLKSYILLPSHIFAPGGTVSWGAYLGIVIGVTLYLRHKRQAVLPILDVLGSVMALAPFIGRWSCFLNGDDYGKITSVAWAVRYPRGSLPFAEQANDGIINYSSALSAPVHPNQMYLSIGALLLFIIMTHFWKSKRQNPGLTFGVYWIAYSILRFFLEFYRDESGTTLIPALNFSQMMCTITIIFSVLFIVMLYRKSIKAFTINNARTIQIQLGGK
jgi:phosphatidylglycerol:prolipoprotein diacylglycerol transferase